MTACRSLTIALILLLAMCPMVVQAQANVPRFEPAKCPSIPYGRVVECGYLVVPEEHTRPNGPTIRLGVAIVKSQSSHPAPDPILVLNGGPGAHALLDLPRFLDAYGQLLSDLDRDMIVFDQRGVGWSQPALDCPELAPSLLALARGRILTDEERLAPYRACRDRWQRQGVNLAAYNTTEIAADANDLWRTLGYTEVNLFGASYGTLLAQTVMRDHPAGIRSVILDSAYPLQIRLFGDAAANASGMVKRVFAACRADRLCHLVYPDVEAVYYQTLERLNREPTHLTTTDPATGERFTFVFDGAELISLIVQANPRQAPGLIYDIRDGNYAPALEQKKAALEALYQYGQPPSRVMAYSVICSQSMYSATPEQFATAAQYPESAWANRFHLQEVLPLPCAEWPARGYDPADRQPVVSDIPTLILAGQYDPTISPDYLRMFAESLPRSLILTVPGAGHGVMLSGGTCVGTIALAFLHDPTRAPDARCLAGSGAPGLDTRFVVRAAAMRLPTQILIALMATAVVWAAGASLVTLRRRSTYLPIVFNWRASLRITGWWPLAGSVAITALALIASKTGWLTVELSTVIATVLPPLAAIQAALLFSPEDEPALEVTLACPREIKWTLFERLGLLISMQIGAALALNLVAAAWTGETLLLTFARWLSPLVLLCGLAVCVTLMTRRAVMGVVVTGLVWFAVSLLGEEMVKRWPFAWPLHFYLRPDHAQYMVNRWFILSLGLVLILMAAPRLLRDQERLLLGSRRASSRRVQRRAVKNDRAVARRAKRTREVDAQSGRSVLVQLTAILRYELLLQWRRPLLLTLVAGMIGLPIFGIFLVRDQFRGLDVALAAGTLSLDQAAARVTVAFIPMAWMGTLMVLMLLLPIVAAETIPRDRQLGVRELLDSLPISPGVYLAGKVLSLWVCLAAGLGAAAILAAILWRWAIGPFKLDIYTEVWLLGALPLGLINSALSLLLAAGQPSTRRAILVGVGFALLSLALMAPGYATHGTILYYLNPARPATGLYYFVGWPGAEFGASKETLAMLPWVRMLTSRQDVWLSIAAGAVQVALVWLIVWWWMRRKG